MPVIHESQYIVTMKSIEQPFETFEGFEPMRETSEYNDGLKAQSSFVIGLRKLSPMTVSKAFDPVADVNIIKMIRDFCPEDEDADMIVSVTPVKYCPTVTPYGRSLILYGVKILGMTDSFRVDRKSNNVARLGVRFIADDYDFA